MKYRMMHFLLIFICCLSPLLSAAEQPTVEESGKFSKHKLERLGKELGLTDDQKTKLKDLFKANKEKLKALKDSNREQLNTTMTPEQQAKLEKLRQKRQALHDQKINVGN